MSRKNYLKVGMVVFIYESSSKYFHYLVSSINSQNVSNFELIFFNDDVKTPSIYFESLRVKYQIINLSKDSPCGIRFQGLKILKELNFDTYIFQDCDDELSVSRVKDVALLAEKHQIVVNDLDLMGVTSNIYESRIWENRFKNIPLFNHRNILKFNFIGFGNTTVNKPMLKFIPDRPIADIVALDWYIFYSILKTSLSIGYFTSSSTTKYRQHPNNQIGIADNDKLGRIIEVKNQFNTLIGGNIIIEANKRFKLPNKKPNHFPFWWELK